MKVHTLTDITYKLTRKKFLALHNDFIYKIKS